MKSFITEANVKQKKWCHDHKRWTLDDWKNVVWSDESSFISFPTNGRVYVWRTPKQAYDPDCLLPTVKHGGGSVMIWAVISCYSASPLIPITGRMNISISLMMKFLIWLAYYCQTLPYSRVIMCLYTQSKRFSLGLRSIRISNIFLDQHNRQTSTYLNIHN